MVDYHVVPAALRKGVGYMQHAAEQWTNAHDALEYASMDPDTTGLLGKSQGVPPKYNSALGTVLQRLSDGHAALENAATTLDQVAKHYEAQEDKYYRKFGYTDQ